MVLSFAVACGSAGTQEPQSPADAAVAGADVGSETSSETDLEGGTSEGSADLSGEGSAGGQAPANDAATSAEAAAPRPASGLSLAPLPALEDELVTALGFARTAVEAYRQGRYDEARGALNRAATVLEGAPLPPAFRRAGLQLLQPSLAAEAADGALPAPSLEELRQRLEAASADRILRRRLDLTRRLEPVCHALGANAPRDARLLDDIAGHLVEQARNPGAINTALRRRARHGAVVRAELRRAGLPQELEALVLVESRYDPQARSPAGARGLWQLTPKTANGFGIRGAQLLDPADSTRAAAAYWRQLQQLFGPEQVTLALAAYNAGENRVLRCLRQAEDPLRRNYEHIAPCLPPETRNHVPKVLAAFLVLADPEAFGLRANAGPGAEQRGQGAGSSASGGATRSETGGSAGSASGAQTAAREHVVEAGETLYRIALRYGLAPEQLARWNGIADPRSLKPGQVLRLAPP
ncbi:MAG: transglycosylase SLT domain-containing protein [Acidobacteriota bacterium]